MRNSIATFIIIAAGLAITAALVSGFSSMLKNAGAAYETVNDESSQLQGKHKGSSPYIIDPETHEVTGRSADWED